MGAADTLIWAPSSPSFIVWIRSCVRFCIYSSAISVRTAQTRMSHGGKRCQNTETIGKNANTVLPASPEDVCWHLDKVQKISDIDVCQVAERQNTTYATFNAWPSCLAFLTSDCCNQHAFALERRRILIMFRPDAVGAKHRAPYRNLTARTNSPSIINQNVPSVRQ